MGIIEEEKQVNDNIENIDAQHENQPVPIDLDSSAMLLRPAEQVEDNEMILLNNNNNNNQNNNVNGAAGEAVVAAQ